MCSSYVCKGSRLALCLLLFLFIFAFLFSNCLLINARWYIHCSLKYLVLLATYLVLVPLFKIIEIWYTIVCFFVNNSEISVSRYVFLHFQLFCIEYVGHIYIYVYVCVCVCRNKNKRNGVSAKTAIILLVKEWKV